MITIIIPVFNEKETIENCLRAVTAAPYEKQIIVVDDASTDGTSEELGRLKYEFEFTLIVHDKNKGKGAAIKSAQQAVAGKAVIIQDGDLEYDPNDYPAVLGPILEEKEKVVYGSRNLKNNPRHSFSFYLGGRLVTATGNMIYGTRLTDINTCYKGFEAEFFKSIPLDEPRFEFCEEVTAKATIKGARIIEVPINYRPRTMEQGKKIRPIDGLRAIMALVKYRFWTPDE